MIWYGTSRNKPSVVRFRTTDGLFGIRIKCWHGKVGEMVYPVRATVENWERYAWLNPCRWVPVCPNFQKLQVIE